MPARTWILRAPQEVTAIAQDAARNLPRAWQVAQVLTELLLNAIEHGNLGFSSEDKHLLMQRGLWPAALRRRLRQPPYSCRVVRLLRWREKRDWYFEVRDEGAGGDHAPGERAGSAAACGRGLLLVEALLGAPPQVSDGGRCVRFGVRGGGGARPIAPDAGRG